MKKIVRILIIILGLFGLGSALFPNAFAVHDKNFAGMVIIFNFFSLLIYILFLNGLIIYKIMSKKNIDTLKKYAIISAVPIVLAISIGMIFMVNLFAITFSIPYMFIGILILIYGLNSEAKVDTEIDRELNKIENEDK